MQLRGVFPTHVGVNREGIMLTKDKESIPHARGGEPMLQNLTAAVNSYSPRTWG